MTTLTAGLAAKLAASATGSAGTTLCTCWRVERADGTVLGFTDHDRDLAFAGDVYRADSGLSGSAWASRLGLAVDTIDAQGALSDDALSEADLARGLFDGAAIRVFRVDWSDAADRALVFAGTIGEVERGPVAFRAELRSLAHALNQPGGRVFSATCDADLGDARCGVSLADPAFADGGVVAGVVDPRAIFTTGGLPGFPTGWFRGGRLAWTAGANDGQALEVKRHTVSGGGAVATIELVEALPFDLAAGDAFTVTAGCDKAVATCRAKFANVANFRGFPHMPGNDWVTSYPVRGEGNDGGSFFKR